MQYDKQYNDSNVYNEDNEDLKDLDMHDIDLESLVIRTMSTWSEEQMKSVFAQQVPTAIGENIPFKDMFSRLKGRIQRGSIKESDLKAWTRLAFNGTFPDSVVSMEQKEEYNTTLKSKTKPWCKP